MLLLQWPVLSPLGSYAQVLVEPGFGIYSFTLAAMLSLLLSHFMSHLHRDACESPLQRYADGPHRTHEWK
jgi:peptidoglycan/LPS O-acetylase OafA/YrhL